MTTPGPVFALDLGSKVGWAMQSNQGQVHSGVEESFGRANRFEGGGMRFVRFEEWLVQNVMGHRPRLVAFEEVRGHKGVDAAHIYGGMLAVLTKLLEQRQIPYMGVPVGVIKRYWSGKGNAPKDVMIRIARERGFNPKDDNEADALAILHWAITYATPSTTDKRPAPDQRPRARVSVGAVPVAPGRVRVRVR